MLSGRTEPPWEGSQATDSVGDFQSPLEKGERPITAYIVTVRYVFMACNREPPCLLVEAEVELDLQGGIARC